MDFTQREWMMLIIGAILSVVIQKPYASVMAYLIRITTSDESKRMLRIAFSNRTASMLVDLGFLVIIALCISIFLLSDSQATKVEIVGLIFLMINAPVFLFSFTYKFVQLRRFILENKI